MRMLLPLRITSTTSEIFAVGHDEPGVVAATCLSLLYNFDKVSVLWGAREVAIVVYVYDGVLRVVLVVGH